MRKKLHVLWGNNTWIVDSNNIIRPHKRITKGHKKWINYRNPAIKSTCDLRIDGHPDCELRRKFTDQIIEAALKQHVRCISDKPICFITCGGTASGKTSAVQEYLDNKKDDLSYLRIDYDALKRQLPEYNHMVELGIQNAAGFTHVESAKMAGKLFKKALLKKMNIIFEKTLAGTDQTEEEIGRLRKKGYLVFLIATHVKEQKGQERALQRYKQGGRFVPPDIIKDTYNKVPASLVRLRDLTDSVVLYDNNGPILKAVMQWQPDSVKIIDRALYDEYLAYVGHDYRLD